MSVLYIKLGLLLMVFTLGAHALDCVPRESVNCTEKSVVEKQCPYGVALDICGYCWICANGFGESCGGVSNVGGTCGNGFNCSNPHVDGSDPQLPGICCRKDRPNEHSSTATTQPLKCQLILHPCSLEAVCVKKRGEACGGQGDLKGICGHGFRCYPKLTPSGEVPENSTCIRSFAPIKDT